MTPAAGTVHSEPSGPSDGKSRGYVLYSKPSVRLAMESKSPRGMESSGRDDEVRCVLWSSKLWFFRSRPNGES
jgi:hypothetical protein